MIIICFYFFFSISFIIMNLKFIIFRLFYKVKQQDIYIFKIYFDKNLYLIIEDN